MDDFESICWNYYLAEHLFLEIMSDWLRNPLENEYTLGDSEDLYDWGPDNEDNSFGSTTYDYQQQASGYYTSGQSSSTSNIASPGQHDSAVDPSFEYEQILSSNTAANTNH
jgi:hypothetical protein